MVYQRVALVTAGSAGLGAAIARVLATEARMSVVINYASNSERAEALVSELRRATEPENVQGSSGDLANGQQRFLAIKADMASRGEIVRLVKETLATMGRLDVVVSNGGWTRMTDFMNLDEGVLDDDWNRCFDMNVKSHLFLFHAAREYLDESEGLFVSTASVAGVKPSGSSLPYAVSKAAQIHLIRSLAVIAAPKIRVNCISPGVLLTEWGRKFPEEKLKAVKERNKLGRFATVEDVAQQVKALVLSKSTTGQNIVIDAGFSI